MTYVADEYGPYSTGAGSDVGEPQWGRIFASLSTSGVSPGVLSSLRVTQRAAGANMSVDVAPGQAFVNGHQGRWVATTNIPIASNLSGITRYDRIIVRSNRTTDQTMLTVLPGAAGVVAALTQNDVIYENHVATITVGNGVASIVNANIDYHPDWAVGRAGSPAAVYYTDQGTGNGVAVPTGVMTVPNLVSPGVIDSVGYWNAAHPSRLTVPESGIYLVGAQVHVLDNPSFAPNADYDKGEVSFQVLENGGTTLQVPQFWYWGATAVAGTSFPFNNPPADHVFSCCSVMSLVATEYVEFSLFQTSGGTKYVSGLLYACKLGVA